MLVVLVDQKKEKKKIGGDDWKERNKERTRRMDCRKVASPLCHEKDGGNIFIAPSNEYLWLR